jgi:hypothetical protein
MLFVLILGTAVIFLHWGETVTIGSVEILAVKAQSTPQMNALTEVLQDIGTRSAIVGFAT